MYGAHAQPNVLSPHSRGTVLEDVWPPVFWGGERLEEIKRKIGELDWAAECYRLLLQEARPILDDEPLLPIEPIGWRHSFYSPTSGEHLIFDPRRDSDFVDPSNQQTWNGEAYRKAWALLVHERTYRLMRSMALLYRLQGDQRFGEWAVTGLQKAIDMFSHRELREGNNSEALYFQPLYDAQVIALIANTCTLLQGTPLYTDALHESVVKGVFEEAMPYQISFLEKRGAHNMTCYVDAALLFAGQLARRYDWVDTALYHPTGGFLAMMNNGLARSEKGEIDGFWREGTQFYHFYSVCPLLSVWAYWKASEELPAPEGAADLEYRLARMLMAPAEMCDEHLRLPVFGDLGAPRRTKLTLYRHVYEMGTGILDDRQLRSVLAAINAVRPTRANLSALAFGPDAVEVKPKAPAGVMLSATGVAFVREGSFHAYLKAGPSLGGHDHCDKLSFGLSAHGQPIIADLGTAGYSIQEYRAYCRSAFGHSTVLINDRPQQKITEAKLDADLEQRRVEATISEGDGVVLSRRILLQAPLLHVEDVYTAETPHLFTCIVHPYGPATVLFPGQPVDITTQELPETGVFSFLAHARKSVSKTPICLEWQSGEGLWLRGWFGTDAPFEYVLGQTPGHPRYDFRNTLLIRIQGVNVRLRMVFEVHTGTATLLTPPSQVVF